MAVVSKKFRVKDDLTTIYNLEIADTNKGFNRVWWFDENGKSQEVSHYTAESIEMHTANGNWVILEDQGLQPIKSDGGSSSYYELTITNKAGESIKCETGDVIRTLVGNDFDFGNCVKALRRMYLATLGMGKEGTDLVYDANKIRWFLGEIERVNK